MSNSCDKKRGEFALVNCFKFTEINKVNSCKIPSFFTIHIVPFLSDFSQYILFVFYTQFFFGLKMDFERKIIGNKIIDNNANPSFPGLLQLPLVLGASSGDASIPIARPELRLKKDDHLDLLVGVGVGRTSVFVSKDFLNVKNIALQYFVNSDIVFHTNLSAKCLWSHIGT